MSSNERRNVRTTHFTNYFCWDPIETVGITNNFVVEFNYQDKLIEIYAKDFFIGQAFKLRFDISESAAIINFLARARNMKGNKQVTRIGEINNFLVDFDGYQRFVTLYEKSTRKWKLGLNETEITAVINLLMKARSLF